MLENNRKYKLLKINKNVEYIRPDVTEETVKNWKSDGRKIPVIILEEKYINFEGVHHQNISGLLIVYLFRNSEYGGPIIILSIFSLDQVKTLVKYQTSRFKEKTERILRTSNIGYFNVNHKNWGDKVKSFIAKNKHLVISKFSIDHVISYSTSTIEAARQLFHDLKNDINEKGFFSYDDSVKPKLIEVEQGFINTTHPKYIRIKNKFIKEINEKDFPGAINSFVDQIEKLNLFLGNTEIDFLDENPKNFSAFKWQVLIIEDDPEFSKRINKALESFGIDSHEAKNRDDALDLLTELDNLIWIISDYQIYLDTEIKTWDTLMGIDLIYDIVGKIENPKKKIHLTLITSKRNLLKKAIKHPWNPPINFFEKSLLFEKEGINYFIQSQLPHLENIDLYNTTYKLPPSWYALKDSGLYRNSKDYKDFKDERSLEGENAVSMFRDRYPDKANLATFEKLWDRLKSDMGKQKWDEFNISLNEEIIKSFKWEGRPKTYYSGTEPSYSHLGLVNSQKPEKFQKSMKERICWRRILLFALYQYRNDFNSETFPTPINFFSDLLKELSIKVNANNFRDAAAFNPDEILNNNLTINISNLPFEEREFLNSYVYHS